MWLLNERASSPADQRRAPSVMLRVISLQTRERGARGAPWVVPVASGEADLMRVSSRAPGAAVFPGSGTLELLRLTRGQSAQGP